MGGGKTEAPPPAPTAGQNYADWIKAYSQYTPQRQAAELSDVQTQMKIAREQIPAILELNRQYGPAYNQQMINLEKQMAPQIAEVQAQTMAQKIAAAQSQASAIRSMSDDPQAAAVRAALGRSVQQDMEAGTSLTPQMQKEIEQSVRAGQQARGMTQGNAAVAAEAFAKGSTGQQLLRQRQAAATQFLQTQSATQIDPWAAYTGQGTTRLSQPLNAQLPQVQGVGALTPMAMQMNNAAALQNQQMQYNVNALNQANKPKWGQLIGTAVGAGIGAIVPGGSAMGAMIGGSLGGAAGGSTGF